MKKSLLLFGIIAWIAVLAAAAIIAGGVLRGGSGDLIFSDNAALLKEEDIALAGMEDILIETDSLDIGIYTTGEPQMMVRQYGGANTAAEELFVVTQNNGGIKIRVKHLFRLNVINFSFNERLAVYIPETWLGDISVKVSSGNIRVDDAFIWRNAGFASSSGDLLLKRELHAENLSIDISSGNIHIREPLMVNGKLSAGTTSGDIRLNAPVQARSIYVRAFSGNIVMSEAAAEQFDLRSTSGDITAAGLSGGGSITASSGNININLTEAVADTDVQAGSGDIRIGVDASCSFNFTGRCSSGSIRANFPLNKNEQGNRASASIGGSPAISINAHTASGNININRR